VRGLAGKPGDDARGGFLGGARSPRPDGTGPTYAEAYHYPERAYRKGQWPMGIGARSRRCNFLCGRAEPAPPRGGRFKQDGLGGKTRDNARGGFLGGARSPRPDGKARRMPRHIIIPKGRTGEANGHVAIGFGQAGAILAGVRSPPLRRFAGRWISGFRKKAPGKMPWDKSP
jgi:hypothetical protein